MFNFRKTNISFVNLKTTNVILKLFTEIDNMIKRGKNKNCPPMFDKRKIYDMEREIFFMEQLNNWQRIFEFRLSCLLISSLDLIPEISVIYLHEFNQFNSRRVGF